ncbi:response regulator [Roseibacterium sp. SDUM158017]|uniref:response regulator n=1 Tax=Roseicyclus salinarum TaxID=3036773 RepID=UPI002414F509|nr:response regulator [Roseibacterium sp. SDUM158017]MDG4648573.1 response regulator [Roseibacterium sp. SDUM158017]
MGNDVNGIDFHPRPTAARPLLGLTVLVVEDSRFSSEAVRLMCLRSGARIRRADCVASARRHLNVYRPSVAIVDLGLPDGSGLDLLAQMHRARPRVPILLGTSGAEREEAARSCAEAGADGFLPKPVSSLAAFQSAILEHLPEALRPNGPRDADISDVRPDPVALREDLAHAMHLLAMDAPPLGYLRRFLLGLARTASDGLLERAAMTLDGGAAGDDRNDLRALLSRRIEDLPSPI